jgi:hypothetical protein
LDEYEKGSPEACLKCFDTIKGSSSFQDDQAALEAIENAQAKLKVEAEVAAKEAQDAKPWRTRWNSATGQVKKLETKIDKLKTNETAMLAKQAELVDELAAVQKLIGTTAESLESAKGRLQELLDDPGQDYSMGLPKCTMVEEAMGSFKDNVEVQQALQALHTIIGAQKEKSLPATTAPSPVPTVQGVVPAMGSQAEADLLAQILLRPGVYDNIHAVMGKLEPKVETREEEQETLDVADTVGIAGEPGVYARSFADSIVFRTKSSTRYKPYDG